MAEMICSLCNAKMEYDSFTSAYVCPVCGHSVSEKNAGLGASAPSDPGIKNEPLKSPTVEDPFAMTSPSLTSSEDPFASISGVDFALFSEPAPVSEPTLTAAPSEPVAAPTPAATYAPAPISGPADNGEGLELLRQAKAYMAAHNFVEAADVLSTLNKRKLQFAALYPQTFLLTLYLGYQVNSMEELFSKIHENGFALKKLVERPGWTDLTHAVAVEQREIFPDVFEYCVICCAYSGEADQILGRRITPATARVHIPDSNGKHKSAFEVALTTTMTRLAGGENLTERGQYLYERILTIEKEILKDR